MDAAAPKNAASQVPAGGSLKSRRRRDQLLLQSIELDILQEENQSMRGESQESGETLVQQEEAANRQRREAESRGDCRLQMSVVARMRRSKLLVGDKQKKTLDVVQWKSRLCVGRLRKKPNVVIKLMRKIDNAGRKIRHTRSFCRRRSIC